MKSPTFTSSALALFAALIAAAPLAAPVQAQRSERVLTIFGTDPCPTSNGEVIVVCNRRPEGERFRIREELRRTDIRGNDVSSAQFGRLVQLLLDARSATPAAGRTGD